jgi:hypothetical protein
MSRPASALLLAAVATSFVLVATAKAQTAFRFADPLGPNLSARWTPALVPGWYEIQTSSLSSGTDTVLAVFQVGGTLASHGADGCPGDLAPSCVRVQVTSTTNLLLLVRAWDITTRGTGNLRIQRTSDGTETSYASSTCLAGTTSTVTDTCWYTWTGLTFGGFTLGMSSAANLHLETRQLPGATTNPVELWTTGDNSSPTDNWRMRFVGGPHRSTVFGTREYTGVFPSGALTFVAGPMDGPNPFEVLRNDYGQFGTTTFGTDADGDGLGTTLEHNWLYTCDGAAGPTSGGLSCAGLVGCSSPTSALCLASLRDSDQDGYEDPLELYGFRSSSGLSPTDLARFGADPARYDVFVEVDVGNQQVSAPAPTCTYTGSAYIDYREATQIVRTYRTATMASFPNRSGTPGIQLHLDIPPVGLYVRSDVAPPANDPNIGTWGGATCYRAPECTANSHCNFGTDTTGECGPVPPSGPRYCARYDALAHGMASSRRWLFRRMFAFGDAIPTATQVFAYGPGGGQTAALVSYGSPETAVYQLQASVAYPGGFAHELGHHAGLDHSGPTLSHVRSQFDQNFAPLRYSVMNYGYTGFGFVETPAINDLPQNASNMSTTVSGVALGGLPALTFTDLDRVSFASGAASLDPLAAPETAVTPAPFDVLPFNNATPLPGAAGLAAWSGVPRWSMSSVRNVDWDGRSGVLPAGQTEETPLFMREMRERRGPPPTPNRWTLAYTPPRFVVRGTRSWLFRSAWTNTSFAPAMTLVETNGAMPCANTPSTTGPRFLACDFAPGEEVPLFLNPGLNTIDPLTFSAASTGGTSIGGAMLVWVDRVTGTLRWGLAQPGQAGALSPHGTITGSPTTTFDGTHVISLARMGGSQNLSLVYRSGSSVMESVLTWSGNTPTWSTPVAISAIAWPLYTGSSPGLTTIEGVAGLADGVLLGVRHNNSVSNIELWRRPTGSAAGAGWVLAGSASVGTSSTSMRGAPQLEFTRARRGSAQDWSLQVTILSGQASKVRRSDANALTFPTAESFGLFLENANVRAIYPTSETWDPRTGANAFRGLRGVSSGWERPAVIPESCTSTGCPSGQTCTVVGSRSLCLVGGYPPGTVFCDSSNSCPSGMTCSPTSTTGSGFCTNLGYTPVDERRHPGADGVIPGRLDVQDDWRMLRQGFCLGQRLQRPLAPVGATIPGTTTLYSSPAPGGPEQTCAFAAY